MPFTQKEIDNMWRAVCEFHGTTPEEIGIGAPLLGCDIPVDMQVNDATRAIAAKFKTTATATPPRRAHRKRR